MGEMTFTLENVPVILQKIMAKLETLEQKMNDLKNNNGRVEDLWFNIDELCEYLPSKPARQPSMVGLAVMPFLIIRMARV